MPPGCSKSTLTRPVTKSFISRLAIVLVVTGLAGSGYAIIMPPFMMGYLGFQRKQKLVLAAAAGLSALAPRLLHLFLELKRLR